MLQKYNRYKLLKIFLYSPTESFRLRELSRLSSISPLSVMHYLDEFEKEGLIEKYNKRGIPFYRAKRDNEKFAFCGDSPNDEPMFEFFTNSVGVANVMNFKNRLKTFPAYVTSKVRDAGGICPSANAVTRR